jgi:phosphate transport system substrate-binding protein
VKNTIVAHAKHLRGLLIAAVAFQLATAVLETSAAADTLIVQGSTTFGRRIMEPFKAAIEAKSGQELTVIPNKSTPGMVALMEGRAHMTMISAPLESEVAKLKKIMPGLDYDRLQAFQISSTRASFAINPANPVRKVSLEQLRKIHTGAITNWSELGGKPGLIRVVLVGGGGGLTVAVEAELLNGRSASNPNVLYVKTPVQLVAIVEQEPNAIGAAQLALVRQRGLPELLTTDGIVEQRLSLVTLGEPTPAMRAVIDAARQIAEKAM